MSTPDKSRSSEALPSPNQAFVQPVDRRRLNRSVPWAKKERGFYATADDMHGVRRVGSDTWERGLRQPYHRNGQYDFTRAEQFKRLRDAQTHVESEEKILPRFMQQRTWFNDRRGL